MCGAGEFRGHEAGFGDGPVVFGPTSFAMLNTEAKLGRGAHWPNGPMWKTGRELWVGREADEGGGAECA